MDGQAAVLVLLYRDASGEHILLTKRAEHMNSHAGEIAFPGGKWELGDETLYQTAARECFEEVGVDVAGAKFEGALKPLLARSEIRVSPFVVELSERPELELCVDEIASAKWIPSAVFEQDLRSKTQVFKVEGAHAWAPVYDYQGYTIWGFTARVLVELCRTRYGLVHRRAHATAPEEFYSVNLGRSNSAG
ncbi:MAG: 8-oxo-dGTP pyrophosphatase MutT (NUDIX family) [Flavobacteriales bacterium]|jgi:8-oxo-dGTP pyrophosphatase MutT (NUDIX family)